MTDHRIARKAPRVMLVQVEKAGAVTCQRVAPEWRDPPMRILCAWCGRHVSASLGPSVMVSHGLCSECEPKLLKEAEHG